MSRYVTVITAREVYRYKMAYHEDKFLHIGAVTIVNNTDHTLHYAIEDELQSRTFLSYSHTVTFRGLRLTTFLKRSNTAIFVVKRITT